MNCIVGILSFWDIYISVSINYICPFMYGLPHSGYILYFLLLSVMIVLFLWVLHSFSNSVRPWGLPLSWIPLWACHWTLFSLGSSPFPSLQFFQTGTIMSQSFDCGMATPFLIWCPIFLLEVGSISSLSLLSGILSKSLPMSPGSLSSPRTLVHSGGSPQLPTSYFHSFC